MEGRISGGEEDLRPGWRVEFARGGELLQAKSDHRWRRVIAGAGEGEGINPLHQARVEDSCNQWRGAIAGGGEPLQVEASKNIKQASSCKKGKEDGIASQM